MWQKIKTTLFHGTISEIHLKAYFDGMYGKIDSIEAKRILLRNLETENLGIQFYIGKQEVADKLIAGIKESEWRK